MKSYPKISIITPTLNRAAFLEETILSVVSQNYPNLEYIIIDGGSTDGTIEIIKKYEKHLSYWISEPDEGMYHAIQKGFDKSTGEIMAWLNSDDKYFENTFSIVSNIFLNIPEINWITGTPTLINKYGECVKVFPTKNWSKDSFFAGDFRWIQQESSFWRRSVWANSGNKLNLEYKYAADFELWVRFFQKTKLHSVNTVFASFRMHDSQLSVMNKNIYELEVQKISKENFKSKNLKHHLLKFLINTQNYFLSSCISPIKKTGSLFQLIIKILASKSSSVYYDFETNNWVNK
jgi:glycosyltransferase involved in cell wall biosynthesis